MLQPSVYWIEIVRCFLLCCPYDNCHVIRLGARWRSGLATLLLWCVAVGAQAEQKDNKPTWVEEQISPTTEWVERAVVPFTRWMEKSIQEPTKQRQQDFVSEVPQPLPAGIISPKEAARLLALLESGQLLRVQWLSSTPPVYVLRMLSSNGRVRVFYMNARDGTLLDTPPTVTEPEDGEVHESTDR